MRIKISNTIYVTIIALLLSTQINAQSKTDRFIDASIGFGYSFPYDEVDIGSSGFYAQGEYVMRFTKWIDIRPYAGIILASSDISDEQLATFGYKSTANAFMLGGKARLTFPIPYVAPYLETGIGASIGSFETITPFTNKNVNGLSMHIPISIGLLIGRKRNVDVSFSYYMHPSAEQFAGAAAFGFAFPLK